MSNPARRSKSRKTIPLFPSSVLGAPIRNALTGSPMEGVVGSLEEKKFWKVVRKDVERWGSDDNGTPVLKTEGYDMASFFFDSPDQYERAFDVVVNQEDKADWYSRNGVTIDLAE